jgi:hypothetical protein
MTVPVVAEYDFSVYDVADNGEFLTFATVDLLHVLNGRAVTLDTLRFSGSSEFPGEDAATQAVSYALAWVEGQTFTLEERLGQYGLEWEREQDDRRAYAGVSS